MGNFFAKLNSNKALKFIVCAVIAIPLGLLIMSIKNGTKENVPADVSIIQKSPTMQEVTKDGKTEEKEVLNYTYQNEEIFVRVFSSDDELTEDYANSKRSELLKEYCESNENKDIQYDMFSSPSMKEEKLANETNAFVEAGTVNNKVYSCGFTKIDNNTVFVFGYGDENEKFSSFKSQLKDTLGLASYFIQQARSDASIKK